MKKRQITVREYKNASGAHTIVVYNARYQECFPNAIEKIIKTFLNDEEVFFGFCRTDGLNLSSEQEKQLENEIPSFFQKNGDFQKLSKYLTVARVKLNNYSYSYIPLAFDYYRETLMFNPKVDWETFKQYHYDYQDHRIDEIIHNCFAEVLIYYFDSGDLMICFDPQKYNSIRIRSMIDRLFGV